MSEKNEVSPKKRRKMRNRGSESLAQVNLVRDEISKLLELGYSFQYAFNQMVEAGKLTCSYTTALKKYFAEHRRKIFKGELALKKAKAQASQVEHNEQKQTVSSVEKTVGDSASPHGKEDSAKLGSIDPAVVHNPDPENAIKLV